MYFEEVKRMFYVAFIKQQNNTILKQSFELQVIAQLLIQVLLMK